MYDTYLGFLNKEKTRAYCVISLIWRSLKLDISLSSLNSFKSISRMTNGFHFNNPVDCEHYWGSHIVMYNGGFKIISKIKCFFSFQIVFLCKNCINKIHSFISFSFEPLLHLTVSLRFPFRVLLNPLSSGSLDKKYMKGRSSLCMRDRGRGMHDETQLRTHQANSWYENQQKKNLFKKL